MDYWIKDDSNNLSCGEKQKISLLRGLLKSADLYIIDEPTNNLDMDTKINHKVNDTMQRYIFT